ICSASATVVIARRLPKTAVNKLIRIWYLLLDRLELRVGRSRCARPPDHVERLSEHARKGDLCSHPTLIQSSWRRIGDSEFRVSDSLRRQKSSKNRAPAAQLNCSGALRLCPPLTEEACPLALFPNPPLTEAKFALAVF